MDGWREGGMDGWRKPNHMRSQIGGPKIMRPVALRRLWGDFHSVAKQASFNVVFGADFRRFWKPKWTPKVAFRAIFFDVIFEYAFASIFPGFFEAPNRKSSNFHYEKP